MSRPLASTSCRSGINLTAILRLAPLAQEQGREDVFRVGYFARIAPEKGLHLLAEAYPIFRKRTGNASVRLDAAGYMSRAHEGYLDTIRKSLAKAGVGDEFTYRGAVDRAGKLAFLSTLDVLSVPTPYDEPKGVFLLEALACSVPVVQPRRGGVSGDRRKDRRRPARDAGRPGGAGRRAVQALERSRAGPQPRRTRREGRAPPLQHRAIRGSAARGVCRDDLARKGDAFWTWRGAPVAAT
jgi:hypothetical protein